MNTNQTIPTGRFFRLLICAGPVAALLLLGLLGTPPLRAQDASPPKPATQATSSAENADKLATLKLQLQDILSQTGTNAAADPHALDRIKMQLFEVLAQTAKEAPSEQPTNQTPTAAPATDAVPTAAKDLAESAAPATTAPPAGQAPSSAPSVASPPAAETAHNSESASTPSAGSATNQSPAPLVAENGTNGLRINLHNAPLNVVLDYLTDAAGFIVDKETEVRGTIDVSSKGPVTRDEAISLIGSNLRKNGYALVREGRILHIEAGDSAKYNTPIEVAKTADAVEPSDEMVTEIIPVHYASVTQLINNLNLLLPTSATLSANESANSLILVATKSDVHRMLNIITALDTSIASVSSIRVFPLRYEDAKDLATLITQLFAPPTSNQTGGGGGVRGALFNMFRGGGGPGGGGGGGGTSTSASGAGAAANRVVAVGDDRSNSLIVSAPHDLLVTIEQMVKEIDQPVEDVSELRVFTLKNADPTDLANQISALYPDETTANNANQGPFPFFVRGGGARGATANTTESERARRMGRVVAVPEPRTKRLLVTASRLIMPQIAAMVTDLDIPGQREKVGFYELSNADPQDVAQALTDLFNRNNVRMNSTAASSRSLLGQNNPLTQRSTATIQNPTTGTTFGSSSSGGRVGLGQ